MAFQVSAKRSQSSLFSSNWIMIWALLLALAAGMGGAAAGSGSSGGNSTSGNSTSGNGTAGFYQWINATATCYGGQDGAGTMGGACGYADLNKTGYGMRNTAVSVHLFRSGASCGSCWEVQCTGVNWGQCSNKSVIVTVTNLCPNGSTGGWCQDPKSHFDMSCPMWNTIASPPKAGVARIRARRVPCKPSGGVGFTVAGNPWWHQFLIFNVGGSGDLSAVEVSIDGGKTYTSLKRDWGSRWTLGGNQINGKSLTFRLTGGLDGKQAIIKNALPAGWTIGNTYMAKGNF